jgi:aspartate aminotransferase
MLAEYTKRRAWLLAALKDIPGFTCSEPEGAFYAFPNVKGCLNGRVRTSAEFADGLLKQEQTVVTDGAAFGTEGYIRISYATSMDQLREGVTRIKRFVENQR